MHRGVWSLRVRFLHNVFFARRIFFKFGFGQWDFLCVWMWVLGFIGQGDVKHYWIKITSDKKLNVSDMQINYN